MRVFATCGSLVLLLLLCVAIPVTCVGCRWANNAEKVAYDEFSASSLRDKYEWFKNAAAKLDAKSASIKVAEANLRSLERQYEGVARKDWPRADLEAHSIRSQELAGLKMSFNQLAADYNSRMSKENYRFCNVGDLPKGATQPMPREFKQYLEQ
jgi:hypothetical protein